MRWHVAGESFFLDRFKAGCQEGAGMTCIMSLVIRVRVDNLTAGF